MRERRNLKIRGTVQGVFFRETVRRLAALYDVKGFVRNVSFDALEVEAEGEPEIVNAFIEKILAHPPRGARIDDVRSAPVAPQEDEGFSVLPSVPLEVSGIGLDAETRCVHYNSPLDVVAIKMRCCGRYFACKTCHDALAGHGLEPWPPEEWAKRAVICGVCAVELTIVQYLESSDRCPRCSAPFNPGCREHYGDYFSGA